MDYGVRVFYGGIVRREDCQSEDLEWFDGPPVSVIYVSV